MAWPCGRYHFFGGAIMRFILTKLLQIRNNRVSLVNLRQRTAEERRRQTLSDKLDNNHV